MEYKGYEIEINQDSDYESPRDWDNAGTMVCFHNRYNLGDSHGMKPDDFDNWNGYVNQLKGVVTLPIYMYDHSGITIQTTPFGCSWDSGQIGFITMDQKTLDKEFNGDKDKGIKCLEQEIKTYDQYLTGDVYGYNVDKLDLSCWGFYGEDYCFQSAKEDIDSYIKAYKIEAQELIVNGTYQI